MGGKNEHVILAGCDWGQAIKRMNRATVIRLVGFKDGRFIHSAPLDPKTEPWFLVRCFFLNNSRPGTRPRRSRHSGRPTSSGAFYTKDAKRYSIYPYRFGTNHVGEWDHENHIIVKQAIERYVTEVGP